MNFVGLIWVAKNQRKEEKLNDCNAWAMTNAKIPHSTILVAPDLEYKLGDKTLHK